MLPRDRLILPLDVDSLAEAKLWGERLGDEVGLFKVGLQLYTAHGPEAVRSFGAERVFLDLKLHDIPATMAKATAVAASQNVALLTVHASAGPDALREVAKAAKGSNTRILAVTVLTSMSEGNLDAVGLAGPIQDAALRLADVALNAGIDGLVCSPHECLALRKRFGADPLLVVPGVRPAGSAADDQTRRATPAEAIRWGASQLVVGRPIRHASDPVAAARAIVREIADAESNR